MQDRVPLVNARAKGPGTATQFVLDELRQAIVAGEYRPGQRLPQEDIAEKIGVSVAPVREALRALEQEGQIDYQPRRGYFLTELNVSDLQEIYALRKVLEEIAVRNTLPALDDEAVERIASSAEECAEAAGRGDVAAELKANRKFHFGMLEGPGQVHVMRLIRLLWDSTENYRAMYYNSPEERTLAVHAHDEILKAIRRRDADSLVAAMDDHRDRALAILTALLSE